MKVDGFGLVGTGEVGDRAVGKSGRIASQGFICILARYLGLPLWRLLPLATVCFTTAVSARAGIVVLGWSEVGLHEMDGGDCSVYALAPPYSTIYAQVITNGLLSKTSGGVKLTYEGVADIAGSINTTSVGKGSFYENADSLYGTALGPDQGLAGFGMPGPTNIPQSMQFDASIPGWTATGIPLTPIDDNGNTNNLPLMKLVARSSSGTVLGSTEIAVPVSYGMDCRVCHASGSAVLARPMEGWVWDCDPVRDYKLNVLRYHDGALLGSTTFSNVLALVGYDTRGLFATVVDGGKAVLCVRCHASNAMPGSGAPGMRPLTTVMHTKHSDVADLVTGLTLDTFTTSSACLQCHAGKETDYVRGVHRNVADATGNRTLQCQNCHGNLTAVGTAGRQGWLDEPSCQNCHTGTAGNNNGQIVYATAFDSTGAFRQAVDATFATLTDPATGSPILFKDSHGHGNLQCAVCHGPAHAELDSVATNDNIQSSLLGGQLGSQLDCSVCHPTTPSNRTGGPHGLHPVGENWVGQHSDAAQGNLNNCRLCHGTTNSPAGSDRGTVLSQMQANRQLNGSSTSSFWRGLSVGCYDCHNGPGGGDGGSARPSALPITATTSATSPVMMSLTATPANRRPIVSYRIVVQPLFGTISVSNNIATYYPDPTASGSDTFSFAAWDGYNESSLGPGTVNVTAAPTMISFSPEVPAAALPSSSVVFEANSVITQGIGGLTYDWDFGDGSAPGRSGRVCHTYAGNGDYTWALTVQGSGFSFTTNGVVTISPTLGPPVSMTLSPTAWFTVVVSWPADHVGTSLETSYDLSSPFNWATDPNVPTQSGGYYSVEEFLVDGQFFRIRRVP